jgi:hypothetical protein
MLAVQPSDLSPAGEFRRDDCLRIAAPTASLHRVSSDELVFRSRGPYWAAWAPGDLGEPIVAVAPLFIISPAPDIDPAYLAWLLHRPTAQAYFSAEAAGTNVQMVSKSALARVPLTVPPIATQRSIVRAAAEAASEHRLSLRLAELRFAAQAANLDRAAQHDTTTNPTRSTR